MAITRRTFGLGLAATGAAGTAGAAWLFRAPVTASLWGFVGGEKEDFVRNARVRTLLADRGLTLDARRAGSVEMVSDRSLLGQRPEWLWPASSVMVEIARRNGIAVRRDEIVFNTPIVIHSWSPVVEALVARGYAAERNGVFFLVQAAELMEKIHAGISWKDLGVPDLFGRAAIVSTHPTRSNSGFVFASLLASLFAGDVASAETMARDSSKISDLFARMGHKPPSSATLWNSYLNEGMGGKPLSVGYESQLIEFERREPERWTMLQSGKVRPVMLYPEPTMHCAHPLIALTARADDVIAALLDRDMQELGWAEHGFRGRFGGVGGPVIPGVLESAPNVVRMPDADVMLSIISGLETT